MPSLFCRFVAALVCGVCLVATSTAQVDSPVVSGTATLPQSNEAQLLSGQIQEAIQDGDYAVAFELMLRLPASGEELVAAPGGRTLYPAWRERVRLQTLLPADARASFEERFGALVSGRLERARREHDLAALKQLFVEFRAAALWDSAAGELVDRLIDAGRFSSAAQVLAVARGASATGRYAIQQIIALGGAGAPLAAGRKLDSLQRNGASGQDPAVPDSAIATLREWFAERAASTRRGSNSSSPTWSLGGAWSVSLEGQGSVPARARAADSGLQDAIDRLRRLPQLQVSLTPNDLIFRCRGAVYAFDPLPLTLRWVALEELPLGTADSSDEADDVESGISADSWNLLTNALRHACATANGRVYTVERIEGRERPVDGFGWQGGASAPAPNLLVARSVDDGRTLWTAGADPRKPLFRVSFQDGACVVGDVVYAVFERNQSAWVAALDARDGRLIRERQVIGPPTYFSSTGGRCQMVTDRDTLFVSTGNGVVAALELPNLTWLWASTYPSSLAAQRGRRWWDRQRVTPPPFGFDPPVIAEDLLLVTPADSESIIAYDRFDGRQRWAALPRALYRTVVGPTRAGVVLLGTSLVCVDPEDGQTIRWRSAPLETQGRPLIGDDGNVYVAAGDGVVAVDGTSGKLLAAPQAMTSATLALRGKFVGEEPAYQGVVLAQDSSAVYAVSPNGVTKYPRLSGLQTAIAARRGGPADDGSAALAAAWGDLAAGRVLEVIEQAEKLMPAGAEQAGSRERLLTHGFLALARSAADPSTRLEWLRRAAPLTTSDQTRARLALAIGEALEASNDLRAAGEHMLAEVQRGDSFLLPNPSDPLRSASPTLSAADAARRLIIELPADVAGEIVAGAIEKCGGEWRALARLRGALPPEQRAPVDAAVLKSAAPYEWLDAALTLAPSGDVESDLERMAAAVAVGDAARARTLADAIGLGGPDNPASLAAGASDVEWRRGLIRHNYRKLLDATEDSPAYDAFMIRWRLLDQRALLDTDGGVAWPFGLAFAPADGQNELRLLEWRAGTTWRKTAADMKYEDADAALADAARRLQSGEDGHEMAGQFASVSSARRFRSLAVVPTARGLIALGLAGFGEENRAGTRMWDVDLAADIASDAQPSWFVDPASRVAVGAPGVAVLRDDGHVRLFDWADGTPRWDRDIVTWEPERIFFCGDRLIVIGAGGEALTLGGHDGATDPHGVPEGTRLREPAAVGDKLWIRTDSEGGVWDFSRGAAVWREPFATQELFLVDADGGIAAVNRLDDRGWTALDLATGASIPLSGLGESADLLSITRRENEIYVVETRPVAPLQTIAYRCFDATSGVARWTREVQTRFVPSPQQLVGNPRVIPVIVQPGDSDGDEGIANWTLVLIDKATGKTSPPERLVSESFNADEGVPDLTLVAASTRILVQLGNRLTAWGGSAWGETP